jgi:hypothetical protein
MFQKDELLYYVNPYKTYGLPTAPQLVKFIKIDFEGKAAVMIKVGTEWSKQRRVKLDYLRRCPQWSDLSTEG